jgi:hypothetical protein
MLSIKQIINEEIMDTVANYPQFGERLLNLHEVGEAIGKPYPYTFDNISYNEVHYDFDTEEDQYSVIFNLEDRIKGIWNLQFGVVGGTPETTTNAFKIANVMATVVKIVNEFIDKFKPNAIKFLPSKTAGDNDMRRHNLYMAYIKKNMRPDYFVHEVLPYIIIEKKFKTIDKNAIQ